MSPKRSPSITRVACTLLAGFLLIQTTACGTIIYPERRGQAAGRIDADMAILDGVGLFFFLIPGVIAFAVDFSTGAIYLPAGRNSRVSELFGRVEVRRFAPGGDARDQLVATLERERRGRLRWEAARAWPVDAATTPRELSRLVARANEGIVGEVGR